MKGNYSMIKFIGIKNLIDSKESLLDYGFLYTLKNNDVKTTEGLLDRKRHV